MPRLFGFRSIFDDIEASLVSLLLIVVMVLCAAFPPSSAHAQAYPSNNPTYIPSAVLAPVTCTAACDVTFTTNNIGTVTIRVTGSGSGIAANVQVTNERNASPTFTSITADGVGSPSVLTIAQTGLWRVNASGMTAVRFHLTAVTGSITVAMSGTPAQSIVQGSPIRRSTYSAAITALAPASSATDLLTITGSATSTVSVTEARCSGISTAAATATLTALVRSTANSGGTSTTPTAVPMDSQSPAATATVNAYTANPTAGTAVGTIRSGKLTTDTAAMSTIGTTPVVWDFGREPEQPVILRGIAQVFAINGAGGTFSSGTVLNCSVTWVEN